MKRHDESISDRLRRMAATDESKVGRGRAEQIAARALARVEARPRQRARLAAAIVSGSAFAIVSVTGIGAVADQAVPGDSLYPVDRAYESISRVIGRDVDRTEERLEEALALAQRGDRTAAANHVNTELGQQSPVIDVRLPDVITDEATAATIEPVPAGDSATEQTAPTVVESEPAPIPEASVATEDAAPVLETDEGEEPGDTLVLALENALRATRAAAETEDEGVARAANEAVRSVVKLAAGEIDNPLQTEQTAPGELTVDTTTTTVSEEAVTAGEETDPDQDETTSTTIQDGQDGSTTTTVPSDSDEEPPGDGETAGDDSGGSQEGSGSAGEPGDVGEEPPGPVILPIP